MKTILAELDRMATQGHALEMGIEYRKGVLSQERIDALNALGFIWDARVQGVARRFASLKPTSLRESSCQSDSWSVLIASQMVSLVTCWSLGLASRHS